MLFSPAHSQVSEYEDEDGEGFSDEEEDESRAAHKRGDEIRYEDFFGSRSRGVSEEEFGEEGSEDEEGEDVDDMQQDLFEQGVCARACASLCRLKALATLCVRVCVLVYVD